MVIVSDGRTYAQTPPSVIINGDFGAGLDDWWFQQTTGGAEFDATDEALCVTITDGGVNPWDVQIGQSDLPLTIGQRYIIEMRVWSDTDRPFSLRMYGSAPWETYTHPFFDISDKPYPIQHLFTMSANDNQATLALHFGGEGTGEVCVDDVRIYTVATPVVAQPPTAQRPPPLPEAVYGVLTPKLWPNNAQSALSFTFDDASETHYLTARPILNQHGFRGTFYVTSGLTINLDEAGTWEQFKQIAGDGHEIGSHTWMHNRLTGLPLGDINAPLSMHHELHIMKVDIETHITGQPVISFAYPFTEYDDIAAATVSQYHASARSADAEANPAYDRAINWYGLSAWAAEYGQPRQTLADDQRELEAMQMYVENKVIAERQWGILLFHEVIPFAELTDNQTWHPTSSEYLFQFVQWLQPLAENGRVWVDTVGNVTRYIKERDSVRAYVTAETADQLQLYVSDTLDDTIYNHPIDVSITVPPTWQSAHVFQGQELVGTVSTQGDSSRRIIETSVVPDGGLVTIADGRLTYSQVDLPGRVGFRPVWAFGILLPIIAVLGYSFWMARQQTTAE